MYSGILGGYFMSSLDLSLLGPFQVRLDEDLVVELAALAVVVD